MPIYEYACKCGYNGDHIAKPGEEVLTCPKCSKKMKRQFHSSFGIAMGVGAYGHYDENLGCYIATNSQRREEMRKQGVTEKIGKGWW